MHAGDENQKKEYNPQPFSTLQNKDNRPAAASNPNCKPNDTKEKTGVCTKI